LPDDLIRGNQGYGRKPSKRGLAAIAEYRPVHIHHYDEAEDVTTIETIHNVQPIFDNNREQLLSGHDGYSPDRTMRKVASIPEGIVAILFKMGINIMDDNDWPKVAALLDDPDWAHLRTAPGKISRKPVRDYPTLKSRD
jgi:hypothetical protein